MSQSITDIADRIASLPDAALGIDPEFGQSEDFAEAENPAPAADRTPEIPPDPEAEAASDDSAEDGAETAPEDAPEDDAEEPADSEDAVEEDSASEEPETAPDDTLYDVKVDGQTMQVTLSELKNGYSRQSDYQRKTADLAEQRRALEATAETLRQQFIDSVDMALSLSGQAEKPDPALLDANSDRHNPEAYYRQREAYDAWSEKMTRVMQERQQLQQQDAASRYQREAIALQEAWPEAAGDKGDALVKNLMTAAREYYHIDRDFLKNINDHRVILALRDGVAWRQAQKAAPETQKALRTKPRVMKPGVKQNPGSTKAQAYRQDRQRLKATGRSEDMAAALLQSGLLD